MPAHVFLRQRGRRGHVYAGLLLLAVLLKLVTLAGCHAPQQPTPPPDKTHLQLLVQTGAAVNLGDDGQPWPTVVTVYQLSSDPEVAGQGHLDRVALIDAAEELLGELIVAKREMTAFPGSHIQVQVDLSPETTHILALAQFRVPQGAASTLLVELPASHGPCLYLSLERSELDGGEFPPPGFSTQPFSANCSARPAAVSPLRGRAFTKLRTVVP